MIHYYLELDEVTEDLDGQTFRVEVADMAEAVSVRDSLALEYFLGIPHVDRFHTCRHDESPAKPCETEVIP